MENPRPGTKADSTGSLAGTGSGPSEETKVVRAPNTPDEADPIWSELGSTRVVEALSDAALSGANLDSPSNYTELSASRVLGKNLTTIGDYRLIRKLGEGAMGAVYKATQVSFQRTVALKILFPHVANNPKLVERLYREGRVMGKLDHPNIIQAYAIDEAAGCHYVAMEYISGHNMQKWLTRLGRMKVPDAVRIILDCARALAYAHDLNLVHRDIKPDNILVTKSGIVKVADFGMVKTHDEDLSLTQTGHAVGTPWFMPLEQARNAKEIDGRSDIYALGCTLYAFLTGQPPFMGRTIVDVIHAKEIGTFPPARQANADVPERLDLIIAKMTAKKPKYRYQNCADLIKDLESLNLAGDKLSFLSPGTALDRADAELAKQSKSASPLSIARSQADVDFAAAAAPACDPDTWYVQYKNMEGTFTVQKYSTAQIQGMLEENMLSPTARASHSATEGFRALGTFKEFQGIALSKNAKKNADKNTARYRGLYKRIEEEDRERAQKEMEKSQPESSARANTRYWTSMLVKVVPAVVAVAGFIAFILWLASR